MATLLTDEYKEKTLVFVGRPLRSVLAQLGQQEITSVIIEGGTRTLGEAFDERLVDQVCFYVAPTLIGGLKLVIGGTGAGSTAESPKIVNPEYTRLGDDIRLLGDIEYPPA
jgi:diaminohydroxyphosphoribosylaminopyrimidine deaminase/5-amino-6-(5-phosphoribosylamino)uracil reductase